MICFSKLGFTVPLASIQEEVNALTNDWQLHFNKFHYEGEWTALALRSPGGKDLIIPDLRNEEQYQDTALMKDYKSIRELINTFKCPVMSVRLLNLKSGAIIKSHKDPELAFEKGEARLHFPIFTNSQVEFYVEDQLIRMEEGDCWYINANLLHRVSNSGASDRIHLVVDCVVNDWLKEVFATSQLTCRPENTEDEQRNIIKSLRLQNTVAADQLADQLENELIKQ